MALGTTQSVTEMSANNICLEVKAAAIYGWQSYSLHMSTIETWQPQAPGNFRTLQACTMIVLPIYIYIYIYIHWGKAMATYP
jgi:hypothetical protein